VLALAVEAERREPGFDPNMTVLDALLGCHEVIRLAPSASWTTRSAPDASGSSPPWVRATG
jgi:hypothetical protein